MGVVDLPGTGLKRSYASQARRVALVEGDVADEATAPRAVGAAIDKFGRLDALVSNAGIMVRKPLRALTLAEWRKVLGTNLTAAYLLARAAEKPLRASRGAIVTIASTRALMSEPNTLPYSASKGGLVALTHALAVSLGPHVRVNCISPGPTETPMMPEFVKATGAALIDAFLGPMERRAKPEEMGWPLAFLNSDGASFITGLNLLVDAGFVAGVMTGAIDVQALFEQGVAAMAARDS